VELVFEGLQRQRNQKTAILSNNDSKNLFDFAARGGRFDINEEGQR
jgi:hypothetical protein